MEREIDGRCIRYPDDFFFHFHSSDENDHGTSVEKGSVLRAVMEIRHHRGSIPIQSVELLQKLNATVEGRNALIRWNTKEREGMNHDDRLVWSEADGFLEWWLVAVQCIESPTVWEEWALHLECSDGQRIIPHPETCIELKLESESSLREFVVVCCRMVKLVQRGCDFSDVWTRWPFGDRIERQLSALRFALKSLIKSGTQVSSNESILLQLLSNLDFRALSEREGEEEEKEEQLWGDLLSDFCSRIWTSSEVFGAIDTNVMILLKNVHSIFPNLRASDNILNKSNDFLSLYLSKAEGGEMSHDEAISSLDFAGALGLILPLLSRQNDIGKQCLHLETVSRFLKEFSSLIGNHASSMGSTFWDGVATRLEVILMMHMGHSDVVAKIFRCWGILLYNETVMPFLLHHLPIESCVSCMCDVTMSSSDVPFNASLLLEVINTCLLEQQGPEYAIRTIFSNGTISRIQRYFQIPTCPSHLDGVMENILDFLGGYPRHCSPAQLHIVAKENIQEINGLWKRPVFIPAPEFQRACSSISQSFTWTRSHWIPI
eukprot:TRINITY_DN2239_c0_g1_i3.p1 TRINITY_DN2239_c0_g1~~TRINITY_DN2239_c0_g1_i3.p1  ORF type:complete len:582 (+),score=116.35 TRINITY_DN2239_c0_g1_i3:109-1746(+)